MLDLTMRLATGKVLHVTLYSITDKGWQYVLSMGGLGDKDPSPVMSREQFGVFQSFLMGQRPPDAFCPASFRGSPCHFSMRAGTRLRRRNKSTVEIVREQVKQAKRLSGSAR